MVAVLVASCAGDPNSINCFKQVFYFLYFAEGLAKGNPASVLHKGLLRCVSSYHFLLHLALALSDMREVIF
jgi:hypothetical protein